MRRKILVLVTVATLATLALVGCGKKDDVTTTATAPTPAPGAPVGGQPTGNTPVPGGTATQAPLRPGAPGK